MMAWRSLWNLVALFYSFVSGSKIVVVKVGGSSITKKAEKETVNDEALDWFANAMANLPDTCESTSSTRFVIIHGAGSFGHHTAKEYGLSGRKPDTLSVSAKCREGLALTRLSVQRLNYILLSRLTKAGIPAVGLSPCMSIPGVRPFDGGHDEARRALQHQVRELVDAGLVPVLHGDAGLYHDERGEVGVGILSGDILAEMLGSASWVSQVIFLTDVDGVFTKDPRHNDDAELIRRIPVVNGEAQFHVEASGSSHEHDVTGGLQVSISTAYSSSRTHATVDEAGCSHFHCCKRYKCYDSKVWISKRPSNLAW